MRPACQGLDHADRDHLCNSFFGWKLFSFVLLAATAYRHCSIKSHNGKGRCFDVGRTNFRRVYSTSLLRHIGTYCACTHAYIPVSTMLQDNMMQLSKLLPTSHQFYSERIPIEYGGRFTLSSISSSVTARLWPRYGCQGGRVCETIGIEYWHRDDHVQVVVIMGWSSTEWPLYIPNIPPVYSEHLSTWFQVSSKKWRLKINEFRSHCDVRIS